MTFRLTDQQTGVVDTMKTGKNFVVDAGAGTGKTRTLVESGNAVTGTGLYTAFNKAIVEEGAGKFRRGIDCLTTHKLAYDAVARAYRKRLDNKARQPARQKAQLLGIRHAVPLSNEVLLQPTTLARLASDAVEKFANSDQREPMPWHVERLTGITDGDYQVLQDAVLPYARMVWEDIQHTDAQGGGRFAFNPGHFRKIWALGDPQLDYDFIMLDEAQDTAGVVAGLLKRQQTQIIAIGDRAQAINEWAGAISAMEKWPADIRLRLSTSFRFGPEVAAEANRWLAMLGDFRLTGAGKASRVGTVSRPRAILCRTNGGTAEEIIDAQKAGLRVALVGKGAADQITRLAQACQDFKDRGHCSHEELVAFRSWSEVVEFAMYDSAGADLKAFVRLIEDHGAAEVESAMRRLVPERSAQVTISTIHRCKGLEWSSVKISTKDVRDPEDEAGEPADPARAEVMANYVAVTRAMDELDLGGLSWVLKSMDERRADAAAKRERRAAARGRSRSIFAGDDDGGE
jgi:superfamily I DNA/RNA helicase